MSHANEKLIVKLRIHLVNPPLNYAYCLQRGKSERLDYIEVSPENQSNISFDLTMEVRKAKTGNSPDFFGPFIQGRSGARFFYLCVGEVDLRADPTWVGRIKAPVTDIDWSEIYPASELDQYLTASFLASNSEGKPVYASVKLMNGWILGKE